jgi:soluble lytic murein transglycosylase-like protein
MIETAALLLHLCGPSAVHLAPHFDRAAHRWYVPPAILVAVGRIESLCTEDADDGDSDYGVMQLREGTRAARGHSRAELLHARLNIDLGARHIRYWWDRCGDLPASLGIYTGGSRTCSQGRRSKRARDVLRLAEQASREPES